MNILRKKSSEFVLKQCDSLKLIVFLMLSIILFLTDCSNDKSTNPDSDIYVMKALVNDLEWSSPAVFEIVKMLDIEALVITGERPNGDKITLAINSKVEKGTFELNETDYAGYTIKGENFSEIFVSKSGTVVISKLEPNICEGTFNFEAISEKTNTASIKSGIFKARLK
jgi:hypothetical protein